MDGKNRFFAWLSKRTVREERSRIYVALSDLNSYCLRQGILTESLFDTYDMKIVLKIRNMIGFDNNFRNTYRGKASLMASSIQYYIYYLQDKIQAESQISEQEAEPMEKSVQDTTQTAGAVQEAAPMEEPLQEAVSEREIVPEEGCKTSVQNEIGNHQSVKDAYLLWLSGQIPPEMMRDYQNAYEIINDYFLMSQYDILEIPDLSVLNMIRTEIAMNEEFRTRNQERLRYIVSAIKTYTQYVQYYVEKSGDSGFMTPQKETFPAVTSAEPRKQDMNPDSNPNLYRSQFVDWMNANGYHKMLFEWPPILTKWGQFANSHGIIRESVFQISDPAQMDRMISALQNYQEFGIADENSKFAISLALQRYREFCADMLSRKKQAEMFLTAQASQQSAQVQQETPQTEQKNLCFIPEQGCVMTQQKMSQAEQTSEQVQEETGVGAAGASGAALTQPPPYRYSRKRPH